MKDRTLLEHFNEVVKHNVRQLKSPADTVQQVHTMLLSKIYNARSNEFLRGINKLQCYKAVDVNIGLRDQLKWYAAEKTNPCYRMIFSRKSQYNVIMLLIIIIIVYIRSIIFHDQFFRLSSACLILSGVSR